MPMPVSGIGDLDGVGRCGATPMRISPASVNLAALLSRQARARLSLRRSVRRRSTDGSICQDSSTGLPPMSSRVIGTSSAISSPQIDRLAAHGAPAGADLGEADQLLEQMLQAAGVDPHALDALAQHVVAVGRQRGVDHIEVAQDGVQRRAELVRDGGEELILGVGGDARRIGLLGGVQRAGGGVRHHLAEPALALGQGAAGRRVDAQRAVVLPVRAQREDRRRRGARRSSLASVSTMRQRSPGQVPSTKRPMPRTNSRVACVSEKTLARSSRKRRC